MKNEKEKKYWQKRKYGLQKLIRLEEKAHKARQEINNIAVERIDGILERFKKAKPKKSTKPIKG